MREDTTVMNQLISSGMLKDVQDPTETFNIPKTRESVPSLNFSSLQKSVEHLRTSALSYQTAASAKTLSPAAQKTLDEVLYKTERSLLTNTGLPRRDWFRHQIYAPGFYTGYGVKTLPGVREAIEQRDWKEAEEQVLVISKVIDQFAAEIDKAAKLY